MKKNRFAKKRNWSVLSLVFFVTIILMMFNIIRQERKVYLVTEKLEVSQQNVRGLNDEHEKLNQEINLLYNDEHIEKIAREKYNMIKPGEVPLVIKKSP